MEIALNFADSKAAKQKCGKIWSNKAMNYELHCEGFPLDDDLRDRLLLYGREFMLEIGEEHPLQMTVKQEQGLVQSRVELVLPSRKVSSLVRRKDPVVAMQAAISAMREALTLG